MAQVVNPRLLVAIIGDTEDIEISDSHVEFSISKDLDEEPNEADLTIYELGGATRDKITAADNQSAPVEIYLTQSGKDELTLAFRGEIDTARHYYGNPMWVTKIHCTSQKENHRTTFVDKKTYAAGTPISDIMQFFIDTIGLTQQVDDLPTTGILLSQSFSGPAFPLLRRFASDVGMYAYILDGVLHVSSIYEPQDPTVTEIERDYLRAAPEPTTRIDEELIEMRTVIESTDLDPFPRKKARRKKKVKKIKVALGLGEKTVIRMRSEDPVERIGESDYVEYDAVDKMIDGVDLEFLCWPSLQPDDLISVDREGYKNVVYRIREVSHYGNNDRFDEWNTDVEADVYEGDYVGP